MDVNGVDVTLFTVLTQHLYKSRVFLLLSENNVTLSGDRRSGNHLRLSPKLRTQQHTQKSPPIERGDRFTGSRGHGVVRLDAFLECSFLPFLPFLSLRCPPRLPPLPPSIPRFCLFYINTIRPGHTALHSLPPNTQTRRHTRLQKEAVDKDGDHTERRQHLKAANQAEDPAVTF